MNRSILSRRRRRKVRKDFELPLTSMMDMLIILLVFLLKSYSTSAVAFTTSDNIALPASNTPQEPTEGMNVMIEPAHFEEKDGKQTVVHGGIILEGTKIVEFTDEPKVIDSEDPQTHAKRAILDPASLTYEIATQLVGDGGRRILPLFDALVKEKEKVEYIEKTQKFEKTVVNPQTGVAEKQVVPPPKFNGTLIIHADKGIQYLLLRKVMYTAAAAEFKTFKLVTSKKEEATAPAEPQAPTKGT